MEVPCAPTSWQVHHIKVIGRSLDKLKDIFMGQLLFRETCHSIIDKAIVVERGQARFLLQEVEASDASSEGVTDVALECSSVDSLAGHIVREGGRLISEPENVTCEDGVIRRATVQSVVASLRHSIFDLKRYHGPFLPNFRASHDACNSELAAASTFERLRFDHVAIACVEGASESILDWYRRCFNMRRCLVSSAETEDEGFVVKHGSTGMRLKALNYWRCMESAVQKSNASEKEFKVVVAEPLSHSGPNQITTFLREYKGQGVQHVAILTDDILTVAKATKSAGLQFMCPPATYYEEVSELTTSTSNCTTVHVDIDLEKLKDSCILMDVEMDPTVDKKADCTCDDVEASVVRESVLYQVFTKPLFDKDTFFMELIQRNGATGFGAANILALWRAVDLYMQSKRIS